jgi:beta-lactamase class A
MRSRTRLLLFLPCVLLLAACRTAGAAVQIEPLPVAVPTRPTLVLRPLPPPEGEPNAGGTASLPSRPTEAVRRDSADPDSSLTGIQDAALLAAIEDALGPDREHVSVAVRRLTDGRGASLNAEREYYAASLFKLALLYEAQRQRTAGELNWSEGVPVTDRDVAEDLGTLAHLGVAVGEALPVRAAVQAMVTRSDNTSAVLMLYRLGPGRVDRTLRALGLRHTSVNTRELPTTAADMARLMSAIVRGTGVDPAWRDDMLSLLLRQENRAGIPGGLPAGVRVGNKTGTWSNATHDVAFVDAPGGLYVLAILSDRGWDWTPLVRVSRAVYLELTRE